VLLVSPAIWQGTTLIAAPLAGNSNGWQAKLRVSLNELILSH
jgi:tRNA(Ile)-lysidine synthase